MALSGGTRAFVILAGLACVTAYGCGAESTPRVACPHPPSVGPLSSVDSRAGSGAAIGKAPVFVHMTGYKGRKSGPGSFVEIYNKRGEGYFIKLFTVLSRPLDGRLRQTVTGLDTGRRAGFDEGAVWDLKPRMSELLPHEDSYLTPETFPLMPGGFWVSGPGCYRLVNEGPGFRHVIDFPVGLAE